MLTKLNRQPAMPIMHGYNREQICSSLFSSAGTSKREFVEFITTSSVIVPLYVTLVEQMDLEAHTYRICGYHIKTGKYYLVTGYNIYTFNSGTIQEVEPPAAAPK